MAAGAPAGAGASVAAAGATESCPLLHLHLHRGPGLSSKTPPLASQGHPHHPLKTSHRPPWSLPRHWHPHQQSPWVAPGPLPRQGRHWGAHSTWRLHRCHYQWTRVVPQQPPPPHHCQALAPAPGRRCPSSRSEVRVRPGTPGAVSASTLATLAALPPTPAVGGRLRQNRPWGSWQPQARHRHRRWARTPMAAAAQTRREHAASR